jgi:hypothetical protein
MEYQIPGYSFPFASLRSCLASRFEQGCKTLEVAIPAAKSNDTFNAGFIYQSLLLFMLKIF